MSCCRRLQSTLKQLVSSAKRSRVVYITEFGMSLVYSPEGHLMRLVVDRSDNCLLMDTHLSLDDR